MIVFQAFDLLYLDGHSLVDERLVVRKRMLKGVFCFGLCLKSRCCPQSRFSAPKVFIHRFDFDRRLQILSTTYSQLAISSKILLWGDLWGTYF